MATISKIRKHSGWVIGAIGAAMLAFLISDVFTSGRLNFLTHGPKGMGSVYGEEVDVRDYQTRFDNTLKQQRANMPPEQSLSPLQEAQINDQVWNDYIDELIMQKEWNNLGIDVTGDELVDMIVYHPHKIALRLLAEPSTGKYDRDRWYQIIKSIDKQPQVAQDQWKNIEDILTKQRCKEKYDNLVKNAMYVTDLEAKDNFIGQNKMYTAEYIPLFTSAINDKDIEVTDKDIQDYINKHKDEYKQEEARSIEYVSFDIAPSVADSNAAKKWIDEQTIALKVSKNDSNFAFSRRGTYSAKWMHHGDFPATLEDEIFSSDSGKIIGPTYENGNYKLMKVSKIKNDSVVYYKASHILITPTGPTEADSVEAENKVRDIYNQIKKGADFAKIATEKSQDPGSGAKGGDLGWAPAQKYVPQFANALKKEKMGDMVIVRTHFGAHLIKLTAAPSSRAVKVLELNKPILAGNETYNAAYAAAGSFRAKIQKPEDFDPQVTKAGLTKRLAKDIKHNDKIIPGIENPRELTRWIYENEIGSVSSPISLNNKIVVAYLGKIKNEGLKSVEDARDEVTPIVRNEKKKDKLMEKVKEALDKNTTMEAVAKAIGSNVNTAEGISFLNTAVPNLANEPALIGYICGSKPNKISGPIRGQGAVFVINVKSVNSINVPATFPERAQLTNADQMHSMEVNNALHTAADVKDYRYLYF